MYEDLTEEKTNDLADIGLLGYVLDKREVWRTDYTSNYEKDHDEYYRLWRAKWAKEDSMRKSERSRLIAPALQQAVESSVAEIEEATFGRGFWFDIRDDMDDPEKEDIQYLRNKLMEEYNNSFIRKDVSECLLNAAVIGTGIGEVVLEEVVDSKPATRPMMDGALQAYGVETKKKLRVRLRPIKPNNFLIDPVATSIDDAVGVIIDEFVPQHQVEMLQDSGVYRSCEISSYQPNEDIEADKEISHVQGVDKVRLTKYYGLVPKDMLGLSEEEVDPFSRYVEAIVVIANDGEILKAEKNPYMMQDRPIVAFSWDIVPSRFWGRGICEKGYMSQKALDTELRARIDALGLIAHPMLALDATRMPRGYKPEIRPGKAVFTQGNPSEVLMPFKFGNLDVNSFTQTQTLQDMVQQATGAVDSTGLLSAVSGETKAGAVSMSLGAVIKRHKRTLINFQDSFWIPFIRKSAWRYMQFSPEEFPVKDYKFTPASTLGIIAREYEVSQLISLLQTMSPDSPLYPALIRSIVENMNLSNREQLNKVLDEAGKPSPEEQQYQKQMQELTIRKETAQIGVYEATAEESRAIAAKQTAQAQSEWPKTQADLIQASMGDLQDDDESRDFERRLQILDRLLKMDENSAKRDVMNKGVARDRTAN